ncbi:MAG: hypothetical protein H7Z72_10140 [Bacteroidetes bacterium]|nr:hypothetical protein [Fibrella sp.]
MQPVDKDTFSYWVTRPDDLTLTDYRHLCESVQAYPYCQALHTLAAKGASMHQKSQTIPLVRQAAAHALSRNALRKLIDNEFQWSDNLLSRLNELSLRHVPIPDDYEQESYALFKAKTGVSDGFPRLPLIRVPKPIFADETEPLVPDDTTLTETTLQNELEQQATPTPGDPGSESPADGLASVAELPKPDPERVRQLEIIEMFIRNQPRISPGRTRLTDVPEQEDLTERNKATIDGLTTESLALIMVRQGKVAKAIEIYEKLILKNPAKSAYFADKINELRGDSPTTH